MKRLLSIVIAVVAVFVLTGCCISHQWEDATCTKPKTCAKCGKTEGEALGHTWVDATCTEPKTCSVCGETEGEALGHKWEDATCTEPKTCSVCGETEGEALGHDWAEATCLDPKTCSRCGETEGEALGHEWVDATCTEPKTCSRCGETEGEALGHTWLDATCTEPKTCSVCGETEGKALGHKWEEATCTEPKTCSVCGETEGKALGHKWVEATCTEPKTCSRCGETEGEALGHKWEDATCTEPKTCSVCGETEGKALGHKWEEATCTEPKTCSVCGETEGKALGHKWVDATWDTPKTCSVCGATEGSAILKFEKYDTQDLINLSKVVSSVMQERQQVEQFEVPVGTWTVGKHLNPGLYSISIPEGGYTYFFVTLNQFGGARVLVSVDSEAGPFSHIYLQEGDILEVMSGEVVLSTGICVPSYEETFAEAVEEDFSGYNDSELQELYSILTKKLEDQELPKISLPGGIWVVGEDVPAGTYDIDVFLRDSHGNFGFTVYSSINRMNNSVGDLLSLHGYGAEHEEAKNIVIPEGSIIVVSGCEAVLSPSDENVFFGAKSK